MMMMMNLPLMKSWPTLALAPILETNSFRFAAKMLEKFISSSMQGNVCVCCSLLLKTVCFVAVASLVFRRENELLTIVAQISC